MCSIDDAMYNGVIYTRIFNKDGTLLKEELVKLASVRPVYEVGSLQPKGYISA